MIDTELRALFTKALDENPPLGSTPAEDVARGRRFRRRRRGRQAIGGLAVTATVAMAATLTPGLPWDDGGTNIAASPDEGTLATGSQPGILLDSPEWDIQFAETYEGGAFITYWRGVDRFSLGWNTSPDDPAMGSLHDYQSQGVPETPATVLGRDATIFEPEDGYYAVIWQESGLEISASGGFDTLEEFTELLNDLYEADDATWQAAMDEATRRFDNTEAIATIASTVPVDEHFTRNVDERLDWIDPADEELLTQEVLHWVACGWVRQRLDGYENHDPSYVDDQLADVLDFAAANDVITEESVWDYAEAIVAGEETVNGRPLYDLFYASQTLRCGGW